jgi:hypothetical protein
MLNALKISHVFSGENILALALLNGFKEWRRYEFARDSKTVCQDKTTKAI